MFITLRSCYSFSLIMLTLCFSVVSFSASAKTCTVLEVKVSALNVRSGPSTGNPVVGVANDGERYVETGKTSGAWKEVWFDSSTRWIYASTSYVNVASAECGTVTGSVLNVRSGPGTGYRVVGTVPSSSSWAVIDSSGSWRQLWFASERRWVHGAYLDQSAAIPDIQITNFTINGGARNTYSRFVTLKGAYDVSSPVYYRVSENSDLSGLTWKKFSSPISYTLTGGDGLKRIYFQVKNSEGRWSNVVSDTINYIETSASGYEIDRDVFYTNLRSYYGSLKPSQVSGINYLLKNMEQDIRPEISSQTVWMRQLAYIMSTVKHEVANTYQPIKEYGSSYCRSYDGGCLYKGRGYVQLTHKYNYKKMSPVVGVDLVDFPERALEPDIAYTVMSYGMFNGSFTGRKLGRYIRSGKTDYYNARRVVNGLDKAGLLQRYARDFEEIMGKSTKRL